MRRTITALLLTFIALASAAPAAHADTPTSVTIEDTAQVLDEGALLPKLSAADFYEPTSVVVYTQAGAPGSNLDLETLDYAREEHPEWLSADNRSWAPGLFLITIDTTARTLNVHTGPDRKISKQDIESIREATVYYRGLHQWNKTVETSVRYGESYVNRPWYFHGVTLYFGGSVALLCVVYLAWKLWFAWQARKSIAASEAKYSQVSADLESTSLYATTLPGQRYAPRLLAEYRDFMDRHELATKLRARIGTFTTLQLFREKNRLLVAEYATLTRELDSVDDALTDANRLLHRLPGWEAVWRREMQYLTDDLAQMDAVTGDTQFTTTAQDLMAWRSRVTPLVPGWTNGVLEGSLPVEDVLDQVAMVRWELTNLLLAHCESAVQMAAQSPQEVQLMRNSMAETAVVQGRSPGIVSRTFTESKFLSVEACAQRIANGRDLLNTLRRAQARRGN